jgi:asparaginyl-tRNA synthetase
VTTLDLEWLGTSGKAPDFTQDFFGKAHLPDGQRAAEAEILRTPFAQCLHLRPHLPLPRNSTRRAIRRSSTMIEPEMAFCD